MLSVAMLLAMQAVGEIVYAPKPDNPETWVLEYPVVVQPYVDDYYGCLRSRELYAPRDLDAGFEQQHRAHVPLCMKKLEAAKASALQVLDGRKGYDEYSPTRIGAIFKTIEFIHVARGRDLDNRLRLHLDQYDNYERVYHQTPDEAGRGQTRDAVVPQASEEAKRPAPASQNPQKEKTSNAQN